MRLFYIIFENNDLQIKLETMMSDNDDHDDNNYDENVLSTSPGIAKRNTSNTAWNNVFISPQKHQ